MDEERREAVFRVFQFYARPAGDPRRPSLAAMNRELRLLGEVDLDGEEARTLFETWSAVVGQRSGVRENRQLRPDPAEREGGSSE